MHRLKYSFSVIDDAGRWLVKQGESNSEKPRFVIGDQADSSQAHVIVAFSFTTSRSGFLALEDGDDTLFKFIAPAVAPRTVLDFGGTHASTLCGVHMNPGRP